MPASEPISDVRRWILMPPPRPRDAVAAVTSKARRRANLTFKITLALFFSGVAGCVLLPPSGPGRETVNMLYFPVILLITGGGLGFLMGLYYRSHRVVFERLVRDSDLASGVVEETWRSSKGAEWMSVRFVRADGLPLRLHAEGHRFTRLCQKGDVLPLLYAHPKYGAVLLPDDELALGVWRKA